MSEPFDLVVIGGGPGGYEAAAHAARLGRKTALVEASRLGGTCLNVGCIPTKAFLRSSRLFADCRSGKAYGVLVDAPRLDMEAVVARKDRLVGTLTRGVASLLKRLGVEVIQGHGELAGRRAVRVNGRELAARNILLATGSAPARPPIPGATADGVMDSTAVLSLTSLPATLAIIGGGYIGLEFAAFFAAVGVPVTVLEMLPQIAPGVDADIARRLRQALEKSGVTILTSCRVSQIERGAVRYQDAAGASQTVAADAVLLAAGRQPVTAGLRLQEVGVDYGPRGIRTSCQGKTNVPGLWACGDVTGRCLLAHAATREGMVAVNNMFGHRDRIRYETIPAVMYTHPEVAAAGRTEQDLQASGIPYRKAVVPMAVSGRFLIENEGGAGAVKVLTGLPYGEILGVHAIGDLSSEFIVHAAALMEMGARAKDIERIVFPHPTVGEALKEAVLEAAR